MNRIAKASETIDRLQPRLAQARKELYAAILEAHREGASVTVIAKLAGLSRQRVDQIIKADR